MALDTKQIAGLNALNQKDSRWLSSDSTRYC